MLFLVLIHNERLITKRGIDYSGYMQELDELAILPREQERKDLDDFLQFQKELSSERNILYDLGKAAI